VTLLDKGLPKLRGIPGERYGLDLQGLIAAAESWRATALAMAESGATNFDAGLLPRIRALPPAPD
jgi:hypothetical protein